MKKLKIVLVEPNQRARITTIKGDLSSMQEMVGGHIQAIYPFEDPVALICNEEGKLNGMDLNRGLKDDNEDLYDIIAGPFFVVGLSGDGFDGLTYELANKYLEAFLYPERFCKIDNRIISITYKK